jgi:CRP-like cAMP-binding protein
MAERSLAGVTLLAELEPEALRDLEARCTWHAFATGEAIIDRDSDTRDVFFITQGTVRVVNYSFSGREVAFDDIPAGSIFGELAALDGQPRSANVVAVEPTLAASLSPTAFREALLRHPRMALNVSLRLARIIRASVDRIMDLSTLGANNRVYAEILRLARPLADAEGRAVIAPIPIHGDVASRVSTTRETVARVFSELNRKGVVRKDGDRLVVADIDRLEEMVEQFRGD